MWVSMPPRLGKKKSETMQTHSCLPPRSGVEPSSPCCLHGLLCSPSSCPCSSSSSPSPSICASGLLMPPCPLSGNLRPLSKEPQHARVVQKETRVQPTASSDEEKGKSPSVRKEDTARATETFRRLHAKGQRRLRLLNMMGDQTRKRSPPSLITNSLPSRGKRRLERENSRSVDGATEQTRLLEHPEKDKAAQEA